MRAIDELKARYQQVMLGKANDETLKKEALRQQDLGTETDKDRAGTARAYSQSPAGKHAMRGVPFVGIGGTQPDTDPVRALLDKEAGNRDRFGDPPPPREED